jgi:uncharacterized protein (TIGR02598 family)
MRARRPENQPPGHLAIAGGRGFSLIEVVLALGIISFAIVGIIGMMPVAMKSAGDSMRETDATLIARRVFAELKTGTGGNRTLFISANGTTNLNLAATSTNNLAFSEDGLPQALFLSTNAPVNAAYDYYARISIANTGFTNLSRVQVDIAYPAAAPAERRTTNSFVTLVGF